MNNDNVVCVKKLRCEYRLNPLGIDVTNPRLSWITESNRRNWTQTAYQILVATSPENLAQDKGNLWDTGKVSSDESVHIVYAGQPLKSKMLCYWKVRVWGGKGQAAQWSEPANWSMGLLNESDWEAKWIGDKAEVPDKKRLPFNGYHSQLSDTPDLQKWIIIDMGKSQTIDTIKLYPAYPFHFRDRPGFMFPVRFRTDVSDQADFAEFKTIIDPSTSDLPNPKETVWSQQFEPVHTRFVRLMVTRLGKRNDGKFGLALAEIELLNQGKNLALGQKVQACEPAYHKWSIEKLVDGITKTEKIGDPRIPPSPLLRSSFNIEGDIRRATVYVTSLGYYEIHINGKRVGDHVLAPEWTNYHKRLQYQNYDVTKLLEPGENAVGATLGDGWYAGRLGPVKWTPEYPRRGGYGLNRRLLFQLVIEKSDGATQTIASDDSWKIYPDGPIRSADNFLGEIYDARKEQLAWDKPGFDDSAWQAVSVDSSIEMHLVAQVNEPIRIVEKLKPITITEPKPGVYIFDFGQNMVGWCNVKVDGPKGIVITLRHGEMLYPDGTLYTDNLNSATQIYKLILDGKEPRVFEPHFTYYGFRYAELTGLKQKPSMDMLTGLVIASDTPQTGTFDCSNAMLNKLFSNIIWTQRGNMHSVPTDCPQRDERLGWMGDAQVFSQTAIFNMDMAAFFTKWITDIRDAQASDGQFPDFAPHPYEPNMPTMIVNNPGWADAGVIVPWRLYQNYVDKEIQQQHYESAKRFINSIKKNNPDLIWKNNTGTFIYGDWLNGDTLIAEGYPKKGGQVPNDVYATAFFAYSTRILSQMADVLSYDEDADRYAHLAENIRAAFNENFVDADCRIKGDTQAGYALALHFDLLAPELRPKAVQHMVEEIKRYDERMSTGFQSTYRMMLELTRWGYNDLAYKLVESTRFPSWGYSIEQGATTIWERWDGYVGGRGFQDPRMNSFNHYAIGAVGEWIYRTILGINPDDRSPGYKHFSIHPQPGGTLKWAKGSYDSIHGRIAVEWNIQDGRFELDVTIPANTTATIYTPAQKPEEVTESGKPAIKANGVSFIKAEDGNAIYKITSGRYKFKSPLKSSSVALGA